VPADWGKKIMHAALVAGEASLLGSDAMPDKYQQPKGISVALHVKEPAEAERIFHALAENGTVTMPIQETFWALRFGTCADRFGIPWMINCAKPQ
jgi:PhnB protein